MGLFSYSIKDPKLKQILKELEKTQKYLDEANTALKKDATYQIKSIISAEKVTYFSNLKKKINDILREF